MKSLSVSDEERLTFEIFFGNESFTTLENKKALKNGTLSLNCYMDGQVYVVNKRQFWVEIGHVEYDFSETRVLIFQNPGFDFSGADISGNYHKGGPKLPDH
jgi:hypothetical protein